MLTQLGRPKKMLGKLALALICAAPALADPLPSPVTDEDYGPVDRDEALLGRDLFYDPILSGNKTVACATCHHPKFATADGVALSFGDGGIGLGPDRRADPENLPEKRIPRNSPALLNLGAREFTVMFHDGRLERDIDAPGGMRTPLDADMVSGFASVLSAQTMFPVLSRDEMAGSYDENEIGKAIRQGRITGNGGAWDLLSKRVAAIPAYAEAFAGVYPHIQQPENIGFTDISNAIAAFIALEWRSDDAPFDAMLRGGAPFEGAEKRGMDLFYGAAGCAVCHSGPFQTDHGFHAMGAPQIGPGKAATFETHQRDDGRFRVTGNPDDRFAFRTPSLRNVLHTAPYGHAGAHADLAAFLADHADPVAGLRGFNVGAVALPAFEADDFSVMRSEGEVDAIAAAVQVAPVVLTQGDIADLIAFLGTLSDPVALEGRLGVPERVPSGLVVP